MSLKNTWSDYWDKIAFASLAVLFAGASLGLEFRYNYMEKAIGRYLAWHNAARQEFGQIWETVSVSETVHRQLEDLVRTKEKEAALDERITSIDQLIKLVFYREKVVMTRDRFLEVYTQLPLYQSSLIIEPVQLLELIGDLPNWQRTLIVFEEAELKFFLVDGLNNVLEEFRLSSEHVNFFLSERETRSLGLDAFASLRGTSYPAQVFYDAWALLTPEQRNGIPLSSQELISWRYRLQRVGINHQSLIGDRMEMGFELSGDAGLETVRILGHTLAVLSLLDKMDKLFFGFSSRRWVAWLHRGCLRGSHRFAKK